MGKRNKRPQSQQGKPDLLKGLADLSLEEIIALQKSTPALLQSKLQQMSNSGDIEAIMKANLYFNTASQNDTRMKSVFFDPNDVGDSGREYKDSKGILSFETLRRMGDIFIVRSVVNTRVEQVQNFLHFNTDEQKAGYTIRKKKQLYQEDKATEKLKKEDQEKIAYIVKFLENGGLNEKWANFDTFQDFGRKLIFDSLTLDQMAFEITRDRGNDLAKFRAVDASLIRLLDSADPKMREAFERYRYKGYLPRYCMAWQGQILQNPTTKEHVIYYPWELGYGVRNKSTSIYRNGYGTSELETLVEIITWMLWGFQYNGNFFSKGSQPKGFINIKNANIDNTSLNEFRQAWTQTMRGVSNCLAGSSEVILENEGLISLESFLGDQECKPTRVWTGKKFQDGQIYRTGLKKKCSMTLANGFKTESSPAHRFKVVSDRGVIEWKKRSELKIGDFVLCNKKPIEGLETLFYKDKMLQEDLFEILGWLTGDGTIGEDKNRARRLSLFYHQEKEQDILKKHSAILEAYGINHRINVIERTEEERDVICKRYGFKSVAKFVTSISIFDTEFYKYLLSVGFTVSHEGKNIPSILYKVSSTMRCAFLKGFFSADGSIVQQGVGVRITISDDNLRNQTRRLLMAEGIQCGCFEYKSSALRQTEKIGVQLLVKDRKEFYERIGFIQSHKQYSYERQQSYSTMNSLHPEMAKLEAKKMRVELFRRFVFEEAPRLADRNATTELQKISKGWDPCTYQKLENLADKHSYELPYEYKDFWFSPIIELSESEEEEEMFDVEIYDNEHQFIVNGMLSHNSHRTPILQGIDMEWIDLQKLSNRDMEFNEWVKFLIIITCSVYRIDPSELGFQFKEQADVFGQDGQHERLKHSKEKGLKPLLIFFQNIINKYIVEEIDEDFEFAFTGIEVEDASKQVELDKKKSEAGFVSFEDMFEKYSGRPYNEETDTILNAQFQQAQQIKQQAEMYAEPVPGEEGGEEEDPFVQYKSIDNPILDASLDYINKHWGKK